MSEIYNGFYRATAAEALTGTHGQEFMRANITAIADVFYGISARNVFFVQDKPFGALGDGSTDDSVACKLAEAAAAGVRGVVAFAPTPLGYVIGDGVTPGSGFVASSGVTYLGYGTKLINRAVGPIGNDLFTIDDVSRVRVQGFEINGESNIRKAVLMRGVLSDITLEDLWCYDHANFSITYGDASTVWSDAHFDGLHLHQIRISGVCGLIGDGSGINIYPRTQVGVIPGGRNLWMSEIDIDVSMGLADENTHGPQCIKINNTKGLYGGDFRLRGGSVASLSLPNGTQEVELANVHTEFSGRGLNINDLDGLGLTTQAHNIKISNFTYDPDGVTTSEGYGITIKGSPGAVKLMNIDVQGDIRIIDDEAGDDLCDVQIRGLTLRDAMFTVEDPGSAWAPVRGISLDDVTLIAADGDTTTPSTSRIILGDPNREAHGCSVTKVRAYSCTNHHVTVYGDANVIRDVTSYDGNPGDIASRCVVLDEGDNNIIRDIRIHGTHHVKNFVRKLAGSGLLVGGFAGTPEDNIAVGFGNMEGGAKDLAQGDITLTSAELTLSGGATDPIYFVASEDYYILGVQILYTVATSVDAGVTLRVGRLNDATNRYWSAASGTSQAAGTRYTYMNTSGADSFGTRKLAKGEAMTLGTVGGKAGAGKAILTVTLVRALTP